MIITKKKLQHAPAPIHSFTTCHNLGRRGDPISCHLVSQPTETNHPRSATVPNETRDADKHVGIGSVRGRSRGGGWWGGWNSPRPWPVASLRSLLLSAAAHGRGARSPDTGLGSVWFGGKGGKAGKGQKARTLRDSNVRERKSSSNALVLGVASDRRRGVTRLVQRRHRPN